MWLVRVSPSEDGGSGAIDGGLLGFVSFTSFPAVDLASGVFSGVLVRCWSSYGTFWAKGSSSDGCFPFPLPFMSFASHSLFLSSDLIPNNKLVFRTKINSFLWLNGFWCGVVARLFFWRP
ncbi:hypothetical protein V6N13_019894 [Hibiscus sabdariffa]|uniref:Uncharacterized protein n=1 Tax=Hibiscus sabdariffa TaxID=183260 RepID=A0ABR2ES89_9ROSI